MHCVLVLDTNEFIGALGSPHNPLAKILFDKILRESSKFFLYIPRTIVTEVRRNLSKVTFNEFMRSVQTVAHLDENFSVPFELGAKYESLGLKPADAFIAGYCEWVKADVLVTENRHFLSRTSDLPFKILTAKKTLLMMK